MQGWNDLTDAIWINMLMLVTSLPVVTAGAALCAGSTALRKSQRGQGTVTRNYFAAFRENLAKATLLWLIFGICGAAIAYSWIVLQITPLLIPKFALTIIWAIGFEWAFYLQARFENPLARPAQRLRVRRRLLPRDARLRGDRRRVRGSARRRMVLHAAGALPARRARLRLHARIARADSRIRTAPVHAAIARACRRQSRVRRVVRGPADSYPVS